MSECTSKYEFGDPIEILIFGKWINGFFVRESIDGSRPLVIRDRTESLEPDWGYYDHNLIRPRTTTPRTGWRLPEPGDVVRVDGIDHDVTLDRVALGMFAGCKEDSCSINGADPRRMTVVRLHDAPQHEPFFKAGESITADKINEALKPLGTLDACLDRVRLLNAGLDLAISVLNADAPPPALRDAAVLAIQAARVKLGGES